MEKEAKPPVLLTMHGDQDENQSCHSVLENQWQHASMPILRRKYAISSTFGWLVLVSDWTPECCLWNPTSMDIIHLPVLRASAYNRCVLTKPPTQPDCHILFNSVDTFVQSFCKIGDHEFTMQYLQRHDDVTSLSAIASSRGKIYGFTKPGNRFVIIDFVDKTLEFKPLLLENGQPWHIDILSRPWSNCHCDYLVESCDDALLLVRKRYVSSNYWKGFCDFKVFRVDVDRKACTELHNIGDRAIFVSFYGCGFCCSSKGIRPNSIYYEENKSVCIYDLDDRSTTLLFRSPGRISQKSSSWVDEQIFQNFMNFIR